MSEWHGWSRKYAGQTPGTERARPSLHIGPIPGRKQKALYSEGGGIITVLAYFKTEEIATEAMSLIDYITCTEEKGV